MSDNNKSLVPVQPSTAELPDFKGYTMEEIRYQRAMMALRKEFCKTKLLQSVAELKPKRKEAKPSSSKLKLISTVASKVFSNLNTLDYVLMGVSLFGTVKKGLNLFKKKK